MPLSTLLSRTVPFDETAERRPPATVPHVVLAVEDYPERDNCPTLTDKNTESVRSDQQPQNSCASRSSDGESSRSERVCLAFATAQFISTAKPGTTGFISVRVFC
jgi:hypothetical protein